MTFEEKIRSLCNAAGWTEVEVVDEDFIQVPFAWEDDEITLFLEQLEDGRGKRLLSLSTSSLPWPEFDDEDEDVEFFNETLHLLLQRNGNLYWGFWGIEEDEHGEEQFSLFYNAPLDSLDEDLFEHVVTEILAEFVMVLDELFE